MWLHIPPGALSETEHHACLIWLPRSHCVDFYVLLPLVRGRHSLMVYGFDVCLFLV